MGRVEDWMDGYVRAWSSNEPSEIAALFTEDAEYYTAPHRDPWRGHDEIVREWIARKEEPEEWDFRYEVQDVVGDRAYVRGWTTYHTEEPDFVNLWVIDLAEDGRCSRWEEWWVPVEGEGAD